jgi:hypothetical protein
MRSDLFAKPPVVFAPKTYHHTCDYCGLPFDSHTHNKRWCPDCQKIPLAKRKKKLKVVVEV